MAEESNNSPSNVIKRILCLASSRKLSGRCVAGRVIASQLPGPWVRPVSSREHQEISEYERNYEDGTDPRVLDVIDVPLLEARPHEFQQENWLLDSNNYWEQKSRFDWAGLQDFVEPDGPLWLNHNSSYNGMNDRIPLEVAVTLRSSLRLIHVDRLTIDVFCPGAAFGNPKRRVQGRFEHDGQDYWLWVTDPVYERRFLAQPNGTYPLGESCLTISLGEPYDNHVYKLIAAIIEREEIEKQ
jgi:hypothetical protein